MAETIRAALERLLAVVKPTYTDPDEIVAAAHAIGAARAALMADGPAVPEGREPASVVGEPSDEELDDCADELLDWNPEGHRAFARAVLARWGHQPAPPAEGEVGELVAWLRGANWDRKRQTLASRAADLLEQRHPAPAPPAEGEVGELVDALRGPLAEPWRGLHGENCLNRAADLLAQRHPEPVPVAKGPTRDDLWELWLRLNNELPDRPAAVAEFWEHAQIDARARAARAQPAPPVEGEVGELVAWLRAWALGTMEEGQPATSRSLTRTADLLAQRYPAPVAVSERLPGPEDCDAEGRCWAWDWPEEAWVLCDRTCAANGFTHWLPAYALPLPQGEVSDDR